MIAHLNIDLPELLQNSEGTADLYTSLSAYAPSQQHSLFNSVYDHYAAYLLFIIENIVRLCLYLLRNYVGYSFFWICRISVMAENCTTICFIASSDSLKLNFLMAKHCIVFWKTMMCRIFWTR